MISGVARKTMNAIHMFNRMIRFIANIVDNLLMSETVHILCFGVIL